MNSNNTEQIPTEPEDPIYSMLNKFKNPANLAGKNQQNKTVKLPEEAKEGIIKGHVVTHAVILRFILSMVKPINFYMEAGLLEGEKLLQKHILYVVIKTVKSLARDLGLGLAFIDGFNYVYNGEFWKQVEAQKIKSFLGKVAEAMGYPKAEAAYYDFIEKLYSQFQSQAVVPREEMDERPILLNMQNGTGWFVNSTFKLKPFSASDYLTHQLKFKYEENAKAIQFQRFLDKVLPDKACQLVLFEYLGYLFIPNDRLKLEKVLLLYGSGANGKSVLFDIVVQLIGSENVTHYALENLTSPGSKSRALISNKILNYASEISGKLDPAFFKQMISGEPVEARLLYQEPFIMRRYAKLIFNCNKLPVEIEQSPAFFRRFLILLFDVTIPANEQDKDLAKNIIASELPGIFNLVLEGLKRLYSQSNFTKSQIIEEQISNFRNQSDSVKVFLDEFNHKPSMEKFVPLQALHSDYKAYCKECLYHPCALNKFSARIRSYGFIVERKNIGNVVYTESITRVVG